MVDMVSFFRNFASRGGGDVAFNAPTIISTIILAVSIAAFTISILLTYVFLLVIYL